MSSGAVFRKQGQCSSSVVQDFLRQPLNLAASALACNTAKKERISITEMRHPFPLNKESTAFDALIGGCCNCLDSSDIYINLVAPH